MNTNTTETKETNAAKQETGEGWMRRLVRLCVDCSHHRINPRGGNVLCANPRLGLDPDIPETGFVAGVSARYMRELWQADDDSEYILGQFKDGICGRAGNWFLPNA